jgi:hypothetical protein
MRKKLVVIAAVFMFLGNNIYAQQSGQSVDKAIQSAKDVISKTRASSGLQIYNAVHHAKLSFCQSSDCEANAGALLNFRYMGERKCANIKDPLFKELCDALTGDACDSIQVPWKRNYCNGMRRDSLNMLEEAMQASGGEISGAVGTNISREELAIGLAIYQGYKQQSISACQQTLRNEPMPVLKKEACSVVFASNPDYVIDGLMTDLAALEVARQNNDVDICNRIGSPALKSECRKNIK